MYPRNAVSPPEIAIGPVVQISDGAVQTTGILISISQNGGAGGAGAGTTRVVEGIVSYTPTQAETNVAEFTVRAYKSGSIPVAITVITSETATSGRVGSNVIQMAGQTVAATTSINLDRLDANISSRNSVAPDNAAIAANGVAIAALSIPTTSEIATAVWNAGDRQLTAFSFTIDASSSLQPGPR